MQETVLKIVNERGLHARAAARFVNLAGHFKSSIRVSNGKDEADGKSILSLMILGASCGTSITLQVEGEDEGEAFTALCTLVETGFDE